MIAKLSSPPANKANKANKVPRKIITPKLMKFILAMAVCLMLIFFNPGKIFSPARSVLLKAAYPFQKTFYITGKKTREFFELLSSISDLKKENERMAKENASFAARIASLEEQKRENETLRKQLELAPRQNYRLESAFVIGQDPRGRGSWIVVDKGKAHGVEAGMPVIVSDGILIGKISEVYGSSAKVLFLTDSASSVNVMDLETGAKGVLSGEYSIGMAMDMVGQTEILNVGDRVVTSGLGGSMPKGFLVGKIQQIENTPDKLFQKALIDAEIEYSKLDVVFIVKGLYGL